jgi:hypothetical protein
MIQTRSRVDPELFEGTPGVLFFVCNLDDAEIKSEDAFSLELTIRPFWLRWTF